MNLLALWLQTACLWEVTARKPGNVHRYCDFEDCTYLDFVLGAAALAPVLATAAERPLGQTVLAAVQVQRQVTPRNTHLGIILLLAPLAAVPLSEELGPGVERLLSSLDLADARAVFAAIRLAQPAGLGQVAEQDVACEPSLPLRAIMALATERDLVARQYANGFREVLQEGVPALEEGLRRTGCLEGAILWCQLTLLARHPDSLIARKQGRAEAEEASRRAAAVLAAGWPHHPTGWHRLHDLDHWLRNVGHRRNPGTTADLVTASLFVALRQRILTLPPSLPWAMEDHDATLQNPRP